MKKYLLFIGFVVFLTCNLFGQTGQVPELVDIPTATKLISIDLDQLTQQINDIENGGGTPDQNLKQKQNLYQRIFTELSSGNTGLTTFLVLAGNANYKEEKSDDEAYQDFLNGNWDEYFAELIVRLRK